MRMQYHKLNVFGPHQPEIRPCQMDISKHFASSIARAAQSYF